MIEDQALLSEDNDDGNDVVLDTGATSHIFHDRRMFTCISPLSKSIFTASGHSIAVSGVGNVKFNVFSYNDDKVSKEIEICDIWYVLY